MSHDYDAVIGIFEYGAVRPLMQVRIKFCTCGKVMGKEDCIRIHGPMDMYHFVTYGVQSVINNYEKCGIRDLMVVLATMLPLEITQYHMWFDTDPEAPADSIYQMAVDVDGTPGQYPTIRMANADKLPKELGLMDMLQDAFGSGGMQIYSVDEEGMRRVQ